MKKLVLPTTLIMLAATPAWAELTQFFAVNIGQTKIDLTGDDQNNLGSGEIDNTDRGYQISFGSTLKNGIMTGLAYTDFGKASVNYDAGDNIVVGGESFTAQIPFGVTAEANSLGAFIAYDYKYQEISIIPKVGYHQWKADLDANAGENSVSTNEKGSDLFYGIGLGYQATEETSVTFGYDTYKLDGDNVEFLYVGTQFSIGE